jgi:integrase
MRVYRRKGSKNYQAEWYENGVRVQRTTQFRDRAAAVEWARERERDAADPKRARARNTTVTAVLELFVTHRQELAGAGKRASETVEFYKRKAGVLLRVFGDPKVFGADRPALDLDAQAVAAYVSRRRAEWANDLRTRHVSDHTIYKEVTVLRAALRLAKKRGIWTGDLEEIFPGADELAAGYQPRARWLPWAEVQALLGHLTGDRAARVAFAVALGAERGALDRALRADVRSDFSAALVRGTKRPTRWRTVPVVTEDQRRLLMHAVKHAEGEGAALFRPWANVDRDLKAACARAGIAPCCFNDLRRTYGHWLRAGGASTDIIGAAMGHADSKMAERVYAKLEPHELATRLRTAFGLPNTVRPEGVCSTAGLASVECERAWEGVLGIEIGPAPTVTYVSRTAGHCVDSVDRVDCASPQVSCGIRCRRSDLNQRPWDYDSEVRLLPAPKKKRRRAPDALTVTHVSRPRGRGGRS